MKEIVLFSICRRDNEGDCVVFLSAAETMKEIVRIQIMLMLMLRSNKVLKVYRACNFSNEWRRFNLRRKSL